MTPPTRARSKQQIKMSVRIKLGPDRIRPSPRFRAMLQCLLGLDPVTTPSYRSLIITSDGFLLGCHTGDIGYNDFIGVASDLERNCRGIAEAAHLDQEETQWLMDRIASLRS